MVRGSEVVEVIYRKRWPIIFLVGCLWFLSNVGVFLAARTSGIEEVLIPYDNVDIIRAEFVPADNIDGVTPGLYLFANFTKKNCDIETLRVAASYAGEVAFIPWTDVDGRESDEDLGLDNRSAGQQTLRILADVDPDFEWLEVRTSHLCPRKEHPDAYRVHKVFARITGGAGT